MIIAVTASVFGQNVPPAKQQAQRVDQRVRVSERVFDGVALKKPLPQPPWSNDKSHEKGEVTVAVLVDYDGTVKRAQIVSDDPILGNVATNAVKQWRFRPYMINGEPYQVESRVVMRFNKKHAELVLGDR